MTVSSTTGLHEALARDFLEGNVSSDHVVLVQDWSLVDPREVVKIVVEGGQTVLGVISVVVVKLVLVQVGSFDGDVA